MAWRSSGATNKELVENLWTNQLITDPRIKEAFLKVDRAHYAPKSPYSDHPQAIGHGATISAPHMHASAVERLLPSLLPTPARPSPRVLDIGSGSGYLTHVLAELVGPSGVVVGVEHIKALADLGRGNMAKSKEGREFLSSGRVTFVVGDGRKGWNGQVAGVGVGEEREVGGKEGWDAIHVGASAVKLHEELLEQLAKGGKMFIPVDDEGGTGDQSIWLVEKGDGEDGEVKKKRLFAVRYVPLTDAPRE